MYALVRNAVQGTFFIGSYEAHLGHEFLIVERLDEKRAPYG